MRADKKNELSVKRKNQLENISYLRASLANEEKNNKTNDFFLKKNHELQFHLSKLISAMLSLY